MDLLQLPDLVLLEVLRQMEPVGRFRVRGVCRRLRDLAVRPHAWQDCSLPEDSALSLVGAVLRLAPCVRYLSLTDSDLISSSLEPLDEVLGSTSCGAAYLRLILSDSGAARITRLLERQIALGRLRHLELHLDLMSKDTATRFLEMLRDCRLERLAVGLPASIPQIPAVLLSPALRLWQLKHRLPDDMTALLQCPTLRILELVVAPEDAQRNASGLRAAAAYFEAATQLADVRLTLLPPSQEHPLVLDLVSALGASGRSALWHLKLECRLNTDPSLMLSRLAAALPGLPRLGLLLLSCCARPQQLRAICLASPPGLEIVCVRSESRCRHAWCHAFQAEELLRGKPALHILVKRYPFEFDEEPSDPCEACDANSDCHPELRHACGDAGLPVFGLYGHEETEPCVLHPQSSVKWKQLRVQRNGLQDFVSILEEALEDVVQLDS